MFYLQRLVLNSEFVDEKARVAARINCVKIQLRNYLGIFFGGPKLLRNYMDI